MTSDQPTPELSVVVPAYNEAESIAPLLERLWPVLAGLGRAFEVLVVDDGSTDGTSERLRAEKRRRPELRAIRLARHSGQSAAMAAGFAAARGGAVVTLDADLQNDPADIPALLAALAGADVVCGWRRDRRDNWQRRLVSRLANAVRNLVSGERISDTGCSLRAYRAEYLRRLRPFRGMHRFLPTLLRMEGARVIEMPVVHHPRRAGRSKYGTWGRLLPGLVDLLAVRWMKSRRLDCRAEELE